MQSIYDHAWFRHIPLLHRILNDPVLKREFPRMPTGRNKSDYFGYWAPLVYMLKSLLGWQLMSKGLIWWIKRGRESHGDACLQLIKDLWDYEGQLDFFMAWVFKPDVS